MPTGDAGAEPLNRQPQEYAESRGSGKEVPRGKGRQSLSRLSRELSPEDLRETGTQKMILDLLDQLQDENEELKEFKENSMNVIRRSWYCGNGSRSRRRKTSSSVQHWQEDPWYLVICRRCCYPPDYRPPPDGSHWSSADC